jgi:hypothetical protein
MSMSTRYAVSALVRYTMYALRGLLRDLSVVVAALGAVETAKKGVTICPALRWHCTVVATA